MKLRYFSVIGLLAILFANPAMAQDVTLLDSAPKASAVIDGNSSAFFVRFDKPVDHIRSSLSIRRDGQVIERLAPRLESAPEVLFARAPTLPPGDYVLHWAVRTMTGERVTEGNIPFAVKSGQ